MSEQPDHKALGTAMAFDLESYSRNDVSLAERLQAVFFPNGVPEYKPTLFDRFTSFVDNLEDFSFSLGRPRQWPRWARRTLICLAPVSFPAMAVAVLGSGMLFVVLHPIAKTIAFLSDNIDDWWNAE